MSDGAGQHNRGNVCLLLQRINGRQHAASNPFLHWRGNRLLVSTHFVLLTTPFHGEMTVMFLFVVRSDHDAIASAARFLWNTEEENG